MEILAIVVVVVVGTIGVTLVVEMLSDVEDWWKK